jgi:hypothetical protein
MTRLVDHAMRHWRDRAAVRAEHCLEPTWHRRLDQLPQRVADRRALRAERRARPRDFEAALQDATARAWGRCWMP